MLDPQFRILAEGLFSHNTVVIHYDSPHIYTQLSESESAFVESVWQKAIQHAYENDRELYNSSLFKLNQVAVTEQEGNPCLTLHIGNTDYRHYVAARHSEANKYLLTPADPIGTSVILVTSDGYVPVGLRSLRMEVNPGRYFTFGGFFDRALDVDMSTGMPDIFACLRRELREELDIDVPMQDLRILGVVYDNRHPHPEVCATVHIKQNKAEIEEAHWNAELSELYMLPLSEIPAFLSNYAHKICDTLYGGFTLFNHFGFLPQVRHI